jgi:hypothetical protein
MAGRDNTKYFYVNAIALDKESWTTQAFLTDMKDHHQAETPGKFAASVIGEYYMLKAKLEQHGIVFAGNAPIATVATNNNNGNGNHSNGSSRRSKSAAVTEHEPEQEGQGNDDDEMGDIANYWNNM